MDHAYQETLNKMKTIPVMKLSKTYFPIDFAVFPLFEKDGMKEIALSVNKQINSKSGVVSVYDSSGSIGRRYARADEIGINLYYYRSPISQ
ncbi:MAG: hypothetical protein CM15mP8_4760 [Methanobacteriota archaeon]|nr:MAG: hypothetical protein CM15mP8_4760 [Euryarchaeota archaeon]